MNFLNNGNNSINLVRPEPIRAPGRRELALRLGAVWCVLAAVAVLLGVIWRLTGLAPDLAATLDGCSLALWAAALAIAPAFNDLLVRRLRHGRHGLRWSPRHATDTGVVWLGAVLIALAPVGLLAAYDTHSLLPELNAYSTNLPLPGWAWFSVVLLVMGPTIVLASTVLLHLLRRLVGTDWGTALWLLAGLLLHRHLVAGGVVPLIPGGTWPPQLDPAGLVSPAALAWPLTLGDYARWWALATAQTGSDAVFLWEFMLNLVRNPAIVAGIALVLLTVIPRPHHHGTHRLNVGWLAALAAAAAVALRGLAVSFLWINDTGRIFPGDWQGGLQLATATLWAVWLAVEMTRPGRTPWLRLRDLCWAWFALGAAAVLTIPNIAADQLHHADVIPRLAVTAVVMTLGLIVINLAARLVGRTNPAQGLLLLCLLAAVLVLPFPAGDSVRPPALQAAEVLAGTALDPALRLYAWGGTTLAGVFCLALWPRRPRQPRVKTAG